MDLSRALESADCAMPIGFLTAASVFTFFERLHTQEQIQNGPPKTTLD